MGRLGEPLTLLYREDAGAGAVMSEKQAWRACHPATTDGEIRDLRLRRHEEDRDACAQMGLYVRCHLHTSGVCTQRLQAWGIYTADEQRQQSLLSGVGTRDGGQLVARPLSEHPYGLTLRQDGTGRTPTSRCLLGGQGTCDGYRRHRTRRQGREVFHHEELLGHKPSSRRTGIHLL